MILDLKKSILRHFAQNHKYLQLEKSTKYCKKGTVGISVYCFISGTGVHLSHCIIFCYALGWRTDMADDAVQYS